MTLLPFIGARYERNWPTKWPAPIEGLPVLITVVDNSTTYFGESGILVSMPWNFPFTQPEWRVTDEINLPLEGFLKEYHPIENVVRMLMDSP